MWSAGLTRQPILFLAVGGIQYLLDTLLFGVFISTGITTVPANVTSRATAAAIGFLLNRYVTFDRRGDTARLFAASLTRFIVFFIIMTLVSTGLILLLEDLAGDSDLRRVIYKISVEAVLAVISFFLSRNWVFKR